jgi:hypothetical protein
VRVPSEAGDGVAKVTISIPDWNDQKLGPTTFAVHLNADPGKFHTAKPWK